MAAETLRTRNGFSPYPQARALKYERVNLEIVNPRSEYAECCQRGAASAMAAQSAPPFPRLVDAKP